MPKAKQRQRGHLLVIDWDFFFENPLDGGGMPEQTKGPKGHSVLGLYDWAHREDSMFIETSPMWTIRASAFIDAQLPLPHVNDEWKTFAQRFKFEDNGMLVYADSNRVAAFVAPDDRTTFESVWLYDAHHDCGYGFRSYNEWLRKFNKDGPNGVECEDWMLVHYRNGARLHYRSPAWHEAYAEEPPKIPRQVTLDHAAAGTREPEDITFAGVVVCRSGAWVPPWCDDDYFAFLDTFTGLRRHSMDNVTKREWGEAELTSAREQAAQITAMREKYTVPA